VPTLAAVLDALEERYPMLRGTIRDQSTLKDGHLSGFLHVKKIIRTNHPRRPLPAAVSSGAEAFLIIGAIAARRARGPHLLDETNLLPSTSFENCGCSPVSFFGSFSNSTPLDFMILAVAKNIIAPE